MEYVCVLLRSIDNRGHFSYFYFKDIFMIKLKLD